jgi:RNA polymerase sigma-70 factor, ECF subfamily
LGVKLNDELVARACAGDDAAAADLICSVWPDAYRIAWSTVRNRAAAEDAAQEACARAWRGLKSLRRPERFAVWFYRIVVNEARRAARAASCEASADAVPAADDASRDDRIAVRAAVDALEPRLRLPIVLRYYYGLRGPEIAQVLGAPPVTVRWWMMLAHRRLRALLEDPASPSQSTAATDGRYTDESIAAG